MCDFVVASFGDLPDRSGWSVLHFTLMPNHVHLLLEPRAAAKPLKDTLRGWKWHTARGANRLLNRTGPFWQSDWFDRWSRNDSETVRLRDYILNNPVKAGLVARCEDHPWTQ